MNSDSLERPYATRHENDPHNLLRKLAGYFDKGRTLELEEGTVREVEGMETGRKFLLDNYDSGRFYRVNSDIIAAPVRRDEFQETGYTRISRLGTQPTVGDLTRNELPPEEEDDAEIIVGHTVRVKLDKDGEPTEVPGTRHTGMGIRGPVDEDPFLSRVHEEVRTPHEDPQPHEEK